MRRISIFLLLATAAAMAQEAALPRFEVASVRRADPADQDETSFMRGGPGTDDPERIMYHHVSLVRLIVLAYGVDFDQVFGPASLGSEWVGQDLYDVTTKVPKGTSKEQLRLMWQDLLTERFHLKAHMDRRPFALYELSLAKGGVKFKPAGARPMPHEPGDPELAPGVKFGLARAPRNTKMICRGCSMADMVVHLAWPLGTLGNVGGLTIGRIADKTGLQGKYDFKLDFAGWYSPGGTILPPLPDGKLEFEPNFFDAIREQLGLNLVEKKGMLDVLMIDHVDRAPTEN
jgi:uncharacterized protein (TIGR03435 family)